MSGSNSSAPGSTLGQTAATDSMVPLGLTVHSMPAPQVEEAVRRTARGRLQMLMVLLVCAAPVIASYFTYFVIRPEGRTNYSELILPARPLPDLPFTGLDGAPVKAATLKGQWLIVVVSGGACDATCERHLWVQRQLRETLGRDKDRVDKLWLITDAAAPRAETLQAISTGVAANVLRVPEPALVQWLTPAAGKALSQHLYIVDPKGDWMMRVPTDPEPSRLKRDVEKLLRASASWDQPGR